MTTVQRNKEIIRRVYEESLNRRDLALLRDLISADYTGIGGLKGIAGFQEPVAALIEGFPDIRWAIEAVIGEGDKVAVKWKWKGTHTGRFMDHAPTGKTITNDGIAIFELRGEKITKADVLTDRLGFLQELDLGPVDVTPLAIRKSPGDLVRFIDKFLVPSAAKKEFYERMAINRKFIRKLRGFIEDGAFEYIDAEGNLVCVTIALWENIESVIAAKEAVEAEYKKQGFDPAEMFQRLNISMERGTYTEVTGSVSL